MTLMEIKDAMGVLPRRADGRVRGISQGLRDEIVFLSERCEAEELCREVGISPVTLRSWRLGKRRKRRRGKFHELAVAVPPEKKTIVVEGRWGLRVLGLEMRDIVSLLREVGHEF